MFNMIKYQLYKLFHSISTYITLAVLIVFEISVIVMNSEYANDPEMISEFTAVNLVAMCIETLMVPAIFVSWLAIFTYGEFSHGSVRTIAPFIRSKTAFYVSIVVAAILMMIIIFGATIITCLVGASILMPEIALGDVGFMFCHVGISCIITFAYAAMVMFAVNATCSILPAVGVIVMILTGAESVLLNLIEQALGKEEFSMYYLSPYMSIFGLTYELKYPEDEMHIVYSIVTAAVLIIVFSISSCIVLNKRDLK